MNDERLAELKEKYKDRNLLEELAWGIYWNHSGYTSKQNGEFLNWLCMMAYRSLKERPQGDLADDVWNLYEKYHSSLATNVIEFGDELKDLLGKYQKGSAE